MMLWSFYQVRSTMLNQGMRTSSIFHTQHVATRRNRVAKRTQLVVPNNVAIRYIELLLNRLAGACKCLAKIVGICCVYLSRSFGRGFKVRSLNTPEKSEIFHVYHTSRN